MKRVGKWVLGLLFSGLLAIGLINFAVIHTTKDQMKTIEQARDAEIGMILGASVNPDGTPCSMLMDRLETGIALYNKKKVKKLLVTGDSQSMYYDETGAMRRYLLDRGVKEEDIVVDPQGLSTSESIKRAKDVLGYNDFLVITQEYHLYRSLYIANNEGIEAEGVKADLQNHGNQFLQYPRETIARCKDFFLGIFS